MDSRTALARLLAELTHSAWPVASESHFSDRAFVENLDDVALLAQSAGFYPKGCGNFTAVFGHLDAPDVVFKLNAGTRDKMEEYHRWLMTQTHPNLPRVYHVEHYLGGCVAVSEKLRPHGTQLAINVPELETLLNSGGFEIDDIHAGNIMFRISDGNSVLNDPSSNRKAYNPEFF